MESLVNRLIRAIVIIAIILAVFLFARILLFSYGIDIKEIAYNASRGIKAFCKKMFPSKGKIRNYRNYLKRKAIK